MSMTRSLFLGTLWLVVALPCRSRADDEIPIRVQRLSDRVVVFTEDSPHENNIVVIASRKGLVVIDTSSSWKAARKIRKMIRKEFGARDFAFVINTHHHWEHTAGNQVFADAIIIGHEHCLEYMRRDDAGRSRRLLKMGQFLEEERARLEHLDPESREARDFRKKLVFLTRNYKSLKEGYVFTPPALTFRTQMNLDLGDLTMKLIYFGRAHSGSDILIEVPEEGILCTGDLFLDRGMFPLFAGMDRLTVPRFIDVLNQVLGGNSRVQTVIPGHKNFWSRRKLELWRDYITRLWKGIVAAEAEGLDPETFFTRCPPGPDLAYLKGLGHTRADLERFHEETILAFWKQLRKSAAKIVEQTLKKDGIEAALKAFADLRSSGRGKFLVSETEFNALGYKLMWAGETRAAIAIFKLNVKMYPGSWNVYDSLGEAYMRAGKKELAVKYYRKSLELNPRNENGKAMLRRLEEQK